MKIEADASDAIHFFSNFLTFFDFSFFRICFLFSKAYLSRSSARVVQVCLWQLGMAMAVEERLEVSPTAFAQYGTSQHRPAGRVGQGQTQPQKATWKQNGTGTTSVSPFHKLTYTRAHAHTHLHTHTHTHVPEHKRAHTRTRRKATLSG